MPRVNKVDSARKTPGTCGKCGCDIAKGEPYVWWKFRFGGKRVRCAKPACAPKPQDLTQSEFKSAIYDLQERTFDTSSIESLEADRDEVVSEVEQLRDEQEEKKSNMPDGLQEGATGELLQERFDALDSAASELQDVDVTDLDDKEDDETDDAFAERCEQHREELAGELSDVLQNISCG